MPLLRCSLLVSPACILSFFIVSLARGEFHDAWSWSDGLEDKIEPSFDKTAAKADGTQADGSVNGGIKILDEGLVEKSPVPSSPPEGESHDGGERKRRAKKQRS